MVGVWLNILYDQVKDAMIDVMRNANYVVVTCVEVTSIDNLTMCHGELGAGAHVD